MGQNAGYRRGETSAGFSGRLPAPAAARQNLAPSGRALSPRPEAVDAVDLRAEKTGPPGGEDVVFTWAGGDAPYALTSSVAPSFAYPVETLALDLAGTTWTQRARGDRPLQFFLANDANTLSPGAQVLGYDPVPPPAPPVFAVTGAWWGDDLEVQSTSMDAIAPGNLLHFQDRPVRPTGAMSGVSGRFATGATFTVPCDAKSGFMALESRGDLSSGLCPWLPLYAKDITLPGITAVCWAPCLDGPSLPGLFYVAAAGGIYQVNLFRRTPTLSTQIAGLTRPYLTRPGNNGTMAYVEGVAGVQEIRYFNPCTGNEYHYAYTTDPPGLPEPRFTRPIRPVGIAWSSDGLTCYIADGDSGKVVRIPYNNGSSIQDNWGNRTFSFPDPCGMDVDLNFQLWVGDTAGQIVRITGQTSSATWNLGGVPRAVLVDRDVSNYTYTRFLWDEAPFADGYNLNPLEDTAGTPVRYHGGTVFATQEGKLRLDPNWTYQTGPTFPQKILLSNTVPTVPYPSTIQTADRMIPIEIHGWQDVPLQLRVVDPPDFAPYVADGGCLQGGCTPVPPYEANDNLGTADWGLAANPGDTPQNPLQITVGAGHSGVVYLKVPPNVSGNNYQVEVTKCNQWGTLLPERIPAFSPVFTTWKRVFVERDKMFRRGGLLFSSYGATGDCGGAEQPPCCETMGQLPCNQMEVYDWTNAEIWDTIVIFDETNTAEGTGEIRVVTDIVDNYNGRKVITLESPMSQSYSASFNDGLSPPKPTFANGRAGGFGTLSGCDPATNQINGPGSCFYEADMRDIQQPFSDGFIEVVGRANGMASIPYVDSLGGLYASGSDGKMRRINLVNIYFDNGPSPNNYFNLMGLRGEDDSGGDGQPAGVTDAQNKYSMIYIRTWETLYPSSPSDAAMAGRAASDHEIGHQFYTNRCSEYDCIMQSAPGQHDFRPWWYFDTTGCPLQNPNACIMDQTAGQRTGGVNRFCEEDLLLGDPKAPCTGSSGEESAIRTETDPIPTRF